MITSPRAGHNRRHLWVIALFLSQLHLIASLPVKIRDHAFSGSHSLEVTTPPSEPPPYHHQHHHEGSLGIDDLLLNLVVSTFLVLFGGVFAGLTLGLMGQDEVYLKVIEQTGEANERKAASDVLKLLNRGKHWVLVTLLLSNVITNETLPIVLDRLLGGGWPAIVSSTAAIVVFGEIIPQSICVRYGLQIGSAFAPLVKFLMYLLYPVAYPISILLDKALGEQHGTVYKKAGLKTLVTLHRDIGAEKLNEDEVTIISSVLDLKEKSVQEIMTPIKKVFVLPYDRILDETTVHEILNSGFNRIPIHVPDDPSNFIGMLLVRTLITYDPDDALPISSFPLASLPETHPSTSCLNILNYFQEGTSHMVLVSANPGSETDSGVLGVLTLEDVIEELIGEEIVDESDVYMDVQHSIVRTNPAPILTKKVVGNVTAPSHNIHNSAKGGTVIFFPSSHTNSPAVGPVDDGFPLQTYDLDKKH
jgi:metal transporter CNNM